MFKVDQKFPEFTLEAYDPRNDYTVSVALSRFKNKFVVLFFYPADFTFVCPTELADLSRRHKEFQAAGAEIICVSTDTVYTHKAWLETEELLSGVKFIMAADHNGKLSKELGIYDEDSGVAQRAAFIIDPDGILRAADITADQIGRSAGEILRKVRALNFTRKNKGLVCPASWEMGAPVLKPSIKIAGKAGKNLKKK